MDGLILAFVTLIPILWNKFCSVCCSDDAVKDFEISPKGICVAFLLPEKP